MNSFLPRMTIVMAWLCESRNKRVKLTLSYGFALSSMGLHEIMGTNFCSVQRVAQDVQSMN